MNQRGAKTNIYSELSSLQKLIDKISFVSCSAYIASKINTKTDLTSIGDTNFLCLSTTSFPYGPFN